VDVEVVGPNGANGTHRTIWIVELASSAPPPRDPVREEAAVIRLQDAGACAATIPPNTSPPVPSAPSFMSPSRPRLGYVVEIADRRGRTRALVSVTPDEAEPAGKTVPGLAAGG
jgi:hypothetical protein